MLDEEVKDESVSEDLAELVKPSEVEITPGSQPETEEVATPSPEESKAEPEKAESEDTAQKKELPFHKHPRWIRMQQELTELRAEKESNEAKVIEKPEEPASVPREFQSLFGEDVESYKAYQSMQRAEARKVAEEIITERTRAEEAKKQAEETAKQGAVSWAEDQFVELGDETGIDFTDPKSTARNQTLDIVLKYGLFDQEGRPKIREANELRPALYPEKSDGLLEEKKRVIAKTNAKSNAAPKEDTVLTSSKLKKMNISQFFN